MMPNIIRHLEFKYLDLIIHPKKAIRIHPPAKVYLC